MPHKDTLDGSSENASYDDNSVPGMLGVSSVDGALRRVRVDAQGGLQISPSANRQYKVYTFTLDSDTNYANGETLNVAYDLAVKYGLDPTKYSVLGTAGFIVTSHDIQFKMNATDNDELVMRVAQWGNIFEFDLGDMGISTLYFANRADSGQSGSALVVVFISG